MKIAFENAYAHSAAHTYTEFINFVCDKTSSRKECFKVPRMLLAAQQLAATRTKEVLSHVTAVA